MKYITKLYLLSLILIATPVIAMDGVAVIDMRTAVLSTQAASDAFKALEEDPDYSSNLEEAKSIQADRQAMAEKLQKDFETLSQEQVAEMQRDIQEKGQGIEFIIGKVQAKQNQTVEKIFADINPTLQKILSELIAAKEVKLLLSQENVLFSDPALVLTDDVTSLLDVALAEGQNEQ